MAMPKKGYTDKLTHKEVIRLFDYGKYIVLPDEGLVCSGKGKPLYTFTGDRSAAKWVRLFDMPKVRAMPVAHCIWIYMTRTPIPKKFQIHHRNLDMTDNRWCNLYCLHKLDHEKLHSSAGVDDLIVEAPF